LEGYWRPLTDTEAARATVLLGAAGDLINEQRGSENFVATACKWVSLDMVKRAMLSQADGVSQQQQAMTDMSVNQVFVNPAGALYITADELRRLNGWPEQNAFSIPLKSNVRVPLEPWNYQQSSQVDLPILPNPLPYPYYPYPYYPYYG
jgi:hypothetical protein